MYTSFSLIFYIFLLFSFLYILYSLYFLCSFEFILLFILFHIYSLILYSKIFVYTMHVCEFLYSLTIKDYYIIIFTRLLLWPLMYIIVNFLVWIFCIRHLFIFLCCTYLLIYFFIMNSYLFYQFYFLWSCQNFKLYIYSNLTFRLYYCKLCWESWL